MFYTNAAMEFNSAFQWNPLIFIIGRSVPVFSNCKSEGIIPSLLQLGKKEVSKEETKERHEGTEKRRNVMKERRNEGTSQGREERKNTEETEEPEEDMCK